MDIGAVGLDVDGVKRDTGHPAYVAVAKALEDFGKKAPSFEEFVHDFENNLPEFYSKYGIDDHEPVHRRYLEHVGETDNEKPYADVLGFLEHVSGLGIPIFVVSGHSSGKLAGWFAEHGLDIHLKCVYGSSRDKHAHLRLACRDVRADPKTTCYIGDWGADMRAATAAGVVPIGITRSYSSRGALLQNGAELVVDHLHELAGRIV